MGFLSMFRKSSSQEIIKDITDSIVLCSLEYRKTIGGIENFKLTANAGAEYSYLLLHIVDRIAFRILEEGSRNSVYDQISKDVLDSYCRAVLSPSTPEVQITSLYQSMLTDLNARQQIYGKCKSLVGDPFPSRGTMIFALGYFIHIALGRSEPQNVEDILCGERDITRAENSLFPDMDDVILLEIHFNGSLKFVDIENRLKKL